MAADKTLNCRDCGTDFMFTAGEQEFFSQKGFSEPTRCPACRAARKMERMRSQTEESVMAPMDGFEGGGRGGRGGRNGGRDFDRGDKRRGGRW